MSFVAKSINGPFTLTLEDETSTEVYSVSCKDTDVMDFKYDEIIAEKELEDGSKDRHKTGIDLTIEVTFSEVDLQKIETVNTTDIATVEINLQKKNRTLSISSPDLVSAVIDGGKTKIRIYKSGTFDQSISDLITES